MKPGLYSLLFLTFFAGCGEEDYQTLYLNLCPVEIGDPPEDPFEGVHHPGLGLLEGQGR